jgi:hypothetical protein
MENLGKHPYQYDLYRIRKHVDDLVANKLFEKAQKSINYIKEQYIDGVHTGEIKTENTFFWIYLKAHHESDQAGIKCPDGTNNKFIYELNQLAKWVKEMKEEKPDPINTPEKGIVLYYLMHHGSAEYEKSHDNIILTKHLRKLGLKGSGIQAYNKGTVHLIEEPKRSKERKYGVFSREEFIKAIGFLKKKDEKAYFYAQSDFDWFCSDEVNQDEGKPLKFFRK